MPQLRMMAVGGWRLFAMLAILAPAVFTIGAVGTASAVYAQGAVIREIRVVGNRRVEPETVRSYLQF
ncbi:MAG TPA: hypothetical protein VE665_07205, partial [Hyphomicrobiaceae bacterium]|nr:hypothetical protein [Hyphomicrobiaceae bacterium]